MTDMTGIAELVKEVKAASENMAAADENTKKTLEDLQKSLGAQDGRMIKIDEAVKAFETKHASFETSLNDLMKKIGRPGAENHTNGFDAKEHKAAFDLLELKHEDRLKKKDLLHPFQPSDDEIKGAIDYRKALTVAMNTLDPSSLPSEIRKSLSAFSFGTNGFLMPPEMSNRVVSCIVDPTDLSGLMSSMNISAPSVRFLIDNQRFAVAAWACEASCFANNPQPDLAEGIGEMEIKPETLRFIVCTTRDLLEDASINVESWILDRVSRGMRTTINNSLILGDGLGKPFGILNPNAGIPILETSVSTPPGQITWQDLVQLKWDIPMEWHGTGTYLMNQRTWGLISTMTDGIGRPLFTPSPIQNQAGFLLNGSPVAIVTQMPDCLPGNTPVAYGDWKQVYMIVWRKAITMQQDPYTAGFCVLYKFEARVGGGILCPNAARLLRVR